MSNRSVPSRDLGMLLSWIALATLILTASPSCAETTYATWLMIWYGRDQAWWSRESTDASKNLVNGEWRTLDWADSEQVDAHLEAIKKAAVRVVIADLTNGWNWLDARCQLIQSLCAKKGMKFCVAENSGGNTAQFESHARDIWRNFAGPDAPYHDTYLKYQGKPLIVCYAIRDWYRAYLRSESPFRSRFSLVWASGEDTNRDKWGWQLEPWVGVVPSRDSMFVTSSVRWNPADGAMWRKSLAFLDYSFALARRQRPSYIIVGSYDDPTERNSWLVSDTSHCEPGRQMRDKTGALSPTAYYERVTQWIRGRPSKVSGGLLRDGAYRLVNRATGEHLGIQSTSAPGQGAPGAVLARRTPDRTLNGLFWFYHLGSNHYRIIALHSGLTLKATDDGSIVQDWDDTDIRQRWILRSASDGSFRLVNAATGGLLCLRGREVTLLYSEAGDSQEWGLRPVLAL